MSSFGAKHSVVAFWPYQPSVNQFGSFLAFCKERPSPSVVFLYHIQICISTPSGAKILHLLAVYFLFSLRQALHGFALTRYDQKQILRLRPSDVAQDEICLIPPRGGLALFRFLFSCLSASGAGTKICKFEVEFTGPCQKQIVRRHSQRE